MAQLLLINPRKRGKRKMANRRKRRTAAQRRATRRLVAMNRARARGNNPRRRKRRRTRRRNPTNNNTRRRYMRTYVANPRRRRRTYRRRRNPGMRRLTVQSVMNNNVIPAFQGGMGALALDFAWGSLPIPPQMKTGMFRHIAKGAGAIVIGWMASNFVRPATAGHLTTGALTVIMHTAMRETVQQFAPQMATYMGEYMEPGMGYYSASEIASPQYGNNNYNNMGQVPYGTPLTPMGEYMEPNNMGYYETGIESEMMGVYE